MYYCNCHKLIKERRAFMWMMCWGQVKYISTWHKCHGTHWIRYFMKAWREKVMAELTDWSCGLLWVCVCICLCGWIYVCIYVCMYVLFMQSSLFVSSYITWIPVYLYKYQFVIFICNKAYDIFSEYFDFLEFSLGI